MPAASVISVSSAIQAATSRAPVIDKHAGGDAGSRFDSHLDAARQQQQDPQSSDPTPPERSHTAAEKTAGSDGSARKSDENAQAGRSDSSADTVADTDLSKAAPDAPVLPQGKAMSDALSAGTKPAAAATSDGKDPEAISADALSVAGAMLALLGQAMPTAASAATGGAAKVMAASVLKLGAGKPGKPGDAGLPAAAAGDTAPDGAPALALAAMPADAKAPDTSVASLINDINASLPAKIAHRDGDAAKVQDLAGLVVGTPQPTSNTGVMPPHALQIASPAGSAGFAHELGQQVAWLGGQDIKQAKIRLHPEELGQLDVKVSVQHNGQVDVTFAAQHPAAVHALQQTLPQLDALLAQHGLSLGQANVGQQQQGRDGQSGSSFAGGGDSSDANEAAIERPAAVSTVGLLDAFA